MKKKTSITLSEELIQKIGYFDKDFKNRSDFIETAIRTYINQLTRDSQNDHDVEVINRNFERLNAETDDTLSYQAPL
jgi:metal-responsive CopG/Arc/MetJ family transcriptional regulator